jgi:hypothetical protein
VEEYDAYFFGDARTRKSLCIKLPDNRLDMIYPGDKIPPHEQVPSRVPPLIQRRLRGLGFKAESTGDSNRRYILRDHPRVDIGLSCYQEMFLPHLAIGVRICGEKWLRRLDEVTRHQDFLENFYGDFFNWYRMTYGQDAALRP